MTQPVRTAPTLAEVAAAAGVSRSTASRALNDSPRISEETKKRVRAAAKEVNFVPNARGRALAVGRTEIIAVLVTEPLSELFSDPTYSEFLSGITEELSESSYLPVILQASSTHERNRAREHFERRSFDAVIDVSPYKGSELLEVLRELGVPTVLCGQLEGHPYRDVFSTVYSDDEEGGHFAALAMKDRGRKDIVAVLGPQDNPAVVDRCAATAPSWAKTSQTQTLSIPAGTAETAIRPCTRSSRARLLSMACSADRTVSRLASSPHSTRQAYPFLRTFLSSASTITRLRRAASPRSRPSASPCAKKDTWPPTLRST